MAQGPPKKLKKMDAVYAAVEASAGPARIRGVVVEKGEGCVILAAPPRAY